MTARDVTNDIRAIEAMIDRADGMIADLRASDGNRAEGQMWRWVDYRAGLVNAIQSLF